ncbi:hypothetical protein ID866_6093 [Astraeus odoratus]|nr:hypothetical protein ID866_6093 [Astraeus odoratus]
MAGYCTSRLLLCPYTEADLCDLTVLCSDPLVQPLVVNDELVTLGPRFRDILRSSMERAAFGVIIRLRKTGEFVGQAMITVDPVNREGVFGICLLPKFWNKGYGTEATRYMVDYSFRWFDLQRISLSVWASNTRARTVYKKVGFKIEGIKRRSAGTSNSRGDILFMGILYEEWASKVPQLGWYC